MSMTKWLEIKARRLRWYDFSLLKLSVLFFAFFLVTFCPIIQGLVLGTAWYWHLGIGVLFAIPLVYKMFAR